MTFREKIFVMLILTAFALIITSCTKREADAIQSKSRVKTYKDGPHYFNSAERVDGTDMPFYFYRFENDEVICYSAKGGEGANCQFKKGAADVPTL